MLQSTGTGPSPNPTVCSTRSVRLIPYLALEIVTSATPSNLGWYAASPSAGRWNCGMPAGTDGGPDAPPSVTGGAARLALVEVGVAAEPRGAAGVSLLDLLARQRTGEVRHRPAGLEDGRLRLMHAVQQEHPLAEPGDELLHRGAIEVPSGRRALETFHDARLVPLGLQPADAPGAGVRERLVVEVHRVLRGKHHAESVRACLLEQRQERAPCSADSRPAAGTRTPRPCRGSRAATRCPAAAASIRSAR